MSLQWVPVDKVVLAMQLAAVAWNDPEVYRKMKEEHERAQWVVLARGAVWVTDVLLLAVVVVVGTWCLLNF